MPALQRPGGFHPEGVENAVAESCKTAMARYAACCDVLSSMSVVGERLRPGRGEALWRGEAPCVTDQVSKSGKANPVEVDA